MGPDPARLDRTPGAHGVRRDPRTGRLGRPLGDRSSLPLDVPAPINGFTAFLYTIPSVALFGILVPYFGLSRLSAVLPLAAYTLLILVTNIVAGFNSVSPEVREAADGMGMTPTRRILHVELPLAMPYIVAGLRIAVVSTVGLVTVAAIIGQGGLGRLILDGLRRTFWTPMTIGAGLSILLALALDGLILVAGRWLTPWAQRRESAL